MGNHPQVANNRGAGADAVGPAYLQELRSEAELVALVHVRLARQYWQRPGGGERALAHRLAAALLLSLISDEPKHWRLSAPVRDIVTLGERAVPGDVAALSALVVPLAGCSYQSLVERLAGDAAAAEQRFRDIADMAARIAREVAAVP